MQIAITIVVGLVSFGFIVLIHELGHFLFALRFNIHVSKFGLGMGPCIYKKVRNGIDYCLCAFPIGGYVVMPENRKTVPEGKVVFSEAPLAARTTVLLAGSATNIIVGFLLMIFVSLFISVGATTTVAQIGNEIVFEEGSEIIPGDVITGVDGKEIKIYMNFVKEVVVLGEPHDVTVLRDGSEVLLHNVRFGVPATDGEQPSSYGVFFAPEDLNILERLRNGAESFRTVSILFVEALVSIFTGQYQISDLTGPVGITKLIGDSVQSSFTTYGMLLAMIAINIGAINLLPLPALDGSRVLIACIEALTHRKLPIKAQDFIHNSGFFFLVGLILVITYNDVSNLLS